MKFDEKILLDIANVERRPLLLDLQIMLRKIAQILLDGDACSGRDSEWSVLTHQIPAKHPAAA